MTEEPLGFTIRLYHSVRLDRHDNNIEPRRIFATAGRWHPDLESPIVTRNGTDADAVLVNLAAGEDIPVPSLDVAEQWLHAARRYYETTEPPTEGHRGPWAEAVADLTEAALWLRHLLLACGGLPATMDISFREEAQ